MLKSSFRMLGSLAFGVALWGVAAQFLNAQTIIGFVPITPCRLVDTRGAAGPFGGPIMSAGTTRQFVLPSSTNCSLPTNASAYSLNVTIVPPGEFSYFSIWPTGQSQPTVSTQNDPLGTIIANAAIVQAGTGGAISVFVSQDTHLVIDINGYFAPTTITIPDTSDTNTTTENVSLGTSALSLSGATGTLNTGVGFGALGSNTNGASNTAIGTTALNSNAGGSYNTAVGQGAMSGNATGSNNVALGYQALFSVATGTDNISIGYQSMFNATSVQNVAIGSSALQGVSGPDNIGIGYESGQNLTTGGNNVDIANQGVAGDNGVIRIGNDNYQTSTFMGGIDSTNVTGSAVIISSTGQLGIMASSRRFKEDIHPMGDASNKLMLLEPVTFHYKKAAPDGSKNLQYGLIAEQVAAIYPELAVYDKNGQIETLQYQQLPAMLLNEIQKQHKTIQDLETRISQLEQLLKSNSATTAAAGSR